MKTIILFGLVAVAAAAPQNPGEAYITRFENENTGHDGKYNFAFETSDGQTRAEAGELINPGTNKEALHVSGSYSFVAQDDQQYEVKYIADENGFQPVGDHLLH